MDYDIRTDGLFAWERDQPGVARGPCIAPAIHTLTTVIVASHHRHPPNAACSHSAVGPLRRAVCHRRARVHGRVPSKQPLLALHPWRWCGALQTPCLMRLCARAQRRTLEFPCGSGSDEADCIGITTLPPAGTSNEQRIRSVAFSPAPSPRDSPKMASSLHRSAAAAMPCGSSAVGGHFVAACKRGRWAHRAVPEDPSDPKAYTRQCLEVSECAAS